MSAAGLLVNVAFYGLLFVLSLYFQQLNHFTPFVTGSPSWRCSARCCR